MRAPPRQLASYGGEKMEKFTEFLVAVDDLVWGIPLIVLIMGTGIYLTVRLGLLQFRKLGKALKYMVKNEEDGIGEVSSFGALCTAMAATIGTGNIVGVATAVVAGGPGALFWMIVAACLGMATKYAEGVLAVKFREDKGGGRFLGGPFYYIERGMGKKWSWLAKTFAVFAVGAGLLGIGTITQVNGIASATKGFFDPNSEHMVSLFGNEYSIATVATAVVVALVTALVVIGGLKRIASVTTIIVPFMAIMYVIVCVSILIYNIEAVPAAVSAVFRGAFGLEAVAGGALGAMMMAMQKALPWNLFQRSRSGKRSYSGGGSQTKEPVRQGLVSMTGTFIDTVIICAMTGTTIMVTGSYDVAIEKGLDGVDVTSVAFANGLPWSGGVGSAILMVSLAFFAFTTILGWDYYSERCLEYLCNGNMTTVKVYRWLYILAVLIGPFLTVSAVWTIADIFNGLMAIPNLIALLALSGIVVAETKSYFDRLNSGQIQG